MAPSPLLNEPKGPDKNSEKSPDDGSRKDKQNTSSDNVDSCAKDKSTKEPIDVNELGEGELKSLLDEAYRYRSPKDREGKSSLFQQFLNEVQESDAENKLIDQNRLKASSAIESSHPESASDQNFLTNILGGSDKKKKKSSKRDGSNSNGNSRRNKFQHSLKITPPTSVYNGNAGAAGNGSNNSNANTGGGSNSNGSNGGANSSYHSSSRGASRTQQSLSTRLNTPAKPATLLTSSSNIDTPMVTTSNKQPIMTPAVVPRKQQKAEMVLLDRGNAASKANSSGDETSGKNEDIELKSLNEIDGCNYTVRASLEIDGNVSKQQTDVDENENDDAISKYGSLMDDGHRSCSTKASSTSILNGNADLSSQRSAAYKPFNGSLDNKEEDNGNSVLELDDGTMINKTKSDNSSTDVVMANGTSSVDEAKTRLLQNKVQNVQSIWTTMYPLNTPFLILNSTDSLTKESLESRKSGDENNYQTKDGSTRKKKKVKPENFTLSENIEGHCGGLDLDTLVTYIEKNHSSSNHGGGGNANSHSINGTASHPKSPRTKQPPANVGNVKGEKQTRGKACTDEDIRSNKKPVAAKAKERLKKSTSLEDLRHSSKPAAKSNKKQSSVDDNQYEAAKTKPSSPVPTSLPPPAKKAVTCESPAPAPIAVKESVDTKRLYYDSPVDDSYTDEFHLVTKKQRKKKRRSKSRNTDHKSSSSVAAAARASMSHGFLPHNYTDRGYDNGGSGGFKRSTRSTENRHRSRRKSVSSVVPSDKISDSDSIHSLPVSSTTPKYRIKKKSTSSGCTPQASYADIAKSPQCQSSMILDGDSTTTAKWQTTKTFSNVSSSSSTNASGGHSTGVESANTVDSPENVELVSSTKYEDHVEVDDGCDQLLLSKNLSSNSCSSSDSAAATESAVGESKNLDNNDDCSNINDSNNNTGNNINRIGVAPKRRSKFNKCNESDDNINVVNNNDNNNCSTNSYSHVCLSGKLDKSAVKEGLNTSTDTNNINNNNHNSVSNKTKKNKNKKKTTAEEHDVTIDQSMDGGKGEKNSNDLFIEYTLAAPSVKTKCSQTQTDLVEVNNNACGSDVTVEETVIVKNNRNSGSSTQDRGSSKLKKLSIAADGAVGDGNRVIVLPSQAAGAKGGNTITVGFEVDANLLDEAAAVSGDQRRSEILKETVERGSKFNVTECVRMVQAGWKEVMDSMSSGAKKVRYYKPE